MTQIVSVTLKGIFRDRVFQGIMTVAVAFLFIPSVASLSMRQVTELSITLSLSLISFIMLLLAIFLGSTSIWRDIERRTAYSVLSLPISRQKFIFGKFLGIACFLLLTSLVLGLAAYGAIRVASGIYPPERPVMWGYLAVAIIFTLLKYLLLVAVAMLLSTVSTSFFLPVFGTISTYLAGGITQQVYDYVNSPVSAKDITPFTKQVASAFYYVVPNLSSFDLNVNAIYGLAPNGRGLILTAGYFVVYTLLLLIVASIIMTKREIR